MSLKNIGIIGTVGIPAKYGGFETLTEHLTKQFGHKLHVTVYCSSKAYPQKLKTHNNADLEYIALNANGLQSIPYDIISLFKAAKTNDTILILGVSGCIILPVFRWFYPQKRILINIDGLEHRREKWNRMIRMFLKYSEKLAVKYANNVITDNKAIKEYVLDEYGRSSSLIAYAGDQAQNLTLQDEIREKYQLPGRYALKVCRIEPENNIHLILEAYSEMTDALVMIGNWSNSKYGVNLKKQYSAYKNIYLLDPIYQPDILNQIRSNCAIYLHGHSAGGTNPALVEAMNLGLPVFTFDCVYNRATTFNEAFYFKDKEDLKTLIGSVSEETCKLAGEKMLRIAKENYTWEKIATQYFKLLQNEEIKYADSEEYYELLQRAIRYIWDVNL